MFPDLTCMSRCSVDAILSGGAGCSGYRRHVTVAQMKEALKIAERAIACFRCSANTVSGKRLHQELFSATQGQVNHEYDCSDMGALFIVRCVCFFAKLEKSLKP